jgi:nucleolin
MVVLDEEADADDDENKKVKKKSKEQRKEKTVKKRTIDNSQEKKRKKDEEEQQQQQGEKGKEKKRKIRQTRTEAASAKVEELNILSSEMTCRICEQTLVAKKFSAKQLLKAKPACMECSKKRAEMAATNGGGGKNVKPERLKKMTKREKLDAAIQRRKQQKEEKRKRNEGAADNDNDDGEKKDEHEDDPSEAGEDAQKEFVPAKMVPSKTERDVDESDEVAQRSMYCGGIPFHKTDEDIRAAFDEEGLDVDSVDCMVFADSGRFRGIAIITFHNVADRDEALKFDGEDWEGFVMVCKPYKVKKADAVTKDPPKKIDGQRVVFVANLDYSVTEDLLRETFAQGSEIKEIRMGLDKDTQDFKGFAHIELVSDGDLARALKKNGKELLGREMKVAYATERRKNPTASFGKGGGEGGQMKKRGKKSSGNIERK